MKPRAFTLLELMAAVLLGAMVMVMIVGGLRSSIRSWEAVQKRVSENYNRRNVLDLMKRQTSSLFFKRDADQIEMSGRRGRRNNNQQRQIGNRNNNANSRTQQAFTPAESRDVGGGGVEFSLPDGASWFMGNVQELNFISTVSFLSDFPGQVAVRYYVVQGEPSDDESLLDLTSSRTEDEMVDDGDIMAADALEGGLWLVMEEKNLFLAAAADEGFGMDSNLDLSASDFEFGSSLGTGMETGSAGTVMKLVGPLRDFTIRYRQPGVLMNADAEDTDENWSEFWDVEAEGFYPSAIEFSFFFEDPGKTDDLPTDELDALRMVIPIYDARNLARGGTDAPF